MRAIDETLIDEVTVAVKDRMQKSPVQKVRGTEFEKIVYEELKNAGIPEENITHRTNKFPDYIIDDGTRKVGIEVKKTDADKWEVPGGSIYESLRNNVETYVLMGKYGGTPDAVYRKYEECISDLKVTHSPRFLLKMDVDPGEDYLSRKNATDLLDLPEGPELNRRIRELLRTDKDTWYGGETEMTAIAEYASLGAEEKNAIFIDAVTLFPETTGSDYKSFAPWMVYKCLVWCPNVRDVFSAGGTRDCGGFWGSAVMGRILDNNVQIKKRISEMTNEEIEAQWGLTDKMDLPERIEKWIGLVGKRISVSSKVVKLNRKNYPSLFSNQEESHKSIIRTKFAERLVTVFGISSNMSEQSAEITEANTGTMKQPVKAVFKGGQAIGCCSQYVECSNAQKCTQEDNSISSVCYYRRNLESGRIFYGKNKTI